jgi:hypothetical protein
MADKNQLDHRVSDNIRVQAFNQPLVPDFLGGPVLLDPASAQFRHKRHDRPCDKFDQDVPFEKNLGGEWIYIGPKHHHFGHIMSEMVHRIVPSKTLFAGHLKYLLVTTSDDDSEPGFESLSRPYQEVLEFCEIDPGQLTILNDNTIVEQLLMCEQGSNFGGRPKPWYLDLLGDFTKRRLDQIHGSRPSPDKVYVSKSKIPHGGTILGESYIEGLLREEGFFVFHPQESPLSLQMDVYRRAHELVFSEGSACHGTELLGEKMLGRTFVLVRRIEVRDDLTRILKPRSQQFQLFSDTLLLGTIAVDNETGSPHTEFSVSLIDLDLFVAFFREHRLARLDAADVGRYFYAAEKDLKAYFSHHMKFDIAEVDAWRIGEVRVAFEKYRQHFHAGNHQVFIDVAVPVATTDDAEKVTKFAWSAHQSKRWLEAVQRWETYRQRFPDSVEGFTLGSVALIELGRFYEADALLSLAMEQFPDHSEVYADYALVAHNRRDWRETVVRWEAFRAKFPDIMMGYSLGAGALCELERYPDADCLIRLGLERKPDDEELLAWVGQSTQNWPEGERRWKKLKALYPNHRTTLADAPELSSRKPD